VSECDASECDVSECSVSGCDVSECSVSECDLETSAIRMPRLTRAALPLIHTVYILSVVNALCTTENKLMD